MPQRWHVETNEQTYELPREAMGAQGSEARVSTQTAKGEVSSPEDNPDSDSGGMELGGEGGEDGAGGGDAQ